MERATVEVYEQRARQWAEARPARHRDRSRLLGAGALPGLARVDLGCGHGPYLADLGEPAVGIDGAMALLRLAREADPQARLVQGALEALPFRRNSLGGGWARNSYLHVPERDLPAALAHLHDALAVGAPFEMSLLGSDQTPRTDQFPGRFFATWDERALADVVAGAGFTIDELTLGKDVTWVRATRARTLPDFVGPGMRVLVCGLNPSLVAADAGYGYAGASNRFWRAATDAGLVSRPRDPFHALRVDAVGMTDFVKRATPRASEVTNQEFREGGARVHRLIEWLQPRIALIVGLAGWRAAVNSKAAPGWQPGETAAPVYVMPSTSGLNARTSLPALTDHITRALEFAFR